MCITFETLSERLDNARMRIQDLLEDLEAQFDAEFSQKENLSEQLNARALEIKSKNLFTQQLIAPIIGADFLAGLDPVTPIWHIFPLHSVKDFRVIAERSVDLPTTRKFSCSLEKFLISLGGPCDIRWRSNAPGEYLRSGILAQTVFGAMQITEKSGREIFVPIASVQQVSVEAVDNLGGNF